MKPGLGPGHGLQAQLLTATPFNSSMKPKQGTPGWKGLTPAGGVGTDANAGFHGAPAAGHTHAVCLCGRRSPRQSSVPTFLGGPRALGSLELSHGGDNAQQPAGNLRPQPRVCRGSHPGPGATGSSPFTLSCGPCFSSKCIYLNSS